MKRNIINKAILLFLSALILLSCSKDNQKYITIGALLPLTGNDSDDGIRALNGLQLAKEEINNNGGILGKKLDIIVLNDRGDESYILQQYNTLKSYDVAAIIGSSYSPVTMALADAAEIDGIPVISPTASHPDITKNRRNVFRAIFMDDYQAETLAYFASNSLNAKTALVLQNGNSSNYIRLGEVFINKFNEFGGEITGIESYSSWDDFSGILRKHSNRKPDIIFCPDDYYFAARLTNLSYEAGFRNTYLLGSDGWDGLLTYVYHPNAMRNVFYTLPFSFDDHDENVIRFVNNYFNAFSQMPLSASAMAYTCVYILAEAINTAGNTDKEKIISAIKYNELDMITGRIKFDENNNPRPNIYIIQIAGGEYSTYKKLSL